MTRLAAPLIALSLLTTPVTAQPAEEDGLSLMEEGALLFFRGLMSEMEPALEELDSLAREMEPMLRDFAAEMGPAFRDLLDQVEDWSMYHPPEILPNGDIILRRRQLDNPDAPGEGTAPEDSIDL